jgi:hypothetical protein
MVSTQKTWLNDKAHRGKQEDAIDAGNKGHLKTSCSVWEQFPWGSVVGDVQVRITEDVVVHDLLD